MLSSFGKLDLANELSFMMEQSCCLFRDFSSIERIVRNEDWSEVHRRSVRKIRRVCQDFNLTAEVRDLAVQVFRNYLIEMIDELAPKDSFEHFIDAAICCVVISSKFSRQRGHLNFGKSVLHEELQLVILNTIGYEIIPQITPNYFISKLSFVEQTNSLILADGYVGELLDEAESMTFAPSTIAIAALFRALPVSCQKDFSASIPTFCLPVAENPIFDVFPIEQRIRMLDVNQSLSLMDFCVKRTLQEIRKKQLLEQEAKLQAELALVMQQKRLSHSVSPVSVTASASESEFPQQQQSSAAASSVAKPAAFSRQANRFQQQQHDEEGSSKSITRSVSVSSAFFPAAATVTATTAVAAMVTEPTVMGSVLCSNMEAATVNVIASTTATAAGLKKRKQQSKEIYQAVSETVLSAPPVVAATGNGEPDSGSVSCRNTVSTNRKKLRSKH